MINSASEIPILLIGMVLMTSWMQDHLIVVFDENATIVFSLNSVDGPLAIDNLVTDKK